MIQSLEISFKFSEELRARINQKHLAIDYKLEKRQIIILWDVLKNWNYQDDKCTYNYDLNRKINYVIKIMMFTKWFQLMLD